MANPFAPATIPAGGQPAARGGQPTSHGLEVPTGGDPATGDTRISREVGDRSQLDIPPERTPPPPKKTPDPGEERVSRIEQRLDKLGGYLVDLHGFLTKKFEALTTPPAKTPPAKGEEDGEGEIDPATKSAMEKLFEEKMGPLVQEYRQDRNRDGLEETKKLHKDWDTYEPAIMEVRKLVPDETMARPGAWEFLYRYVKVQNYDKLVEEIREQVRAEINGETDRPPADMSLRPTSPGGGTNGKVVLTAKERAAADKMGMAYEDYANWKAEPRDNGRRE